MTYKSEEWGEYEKTRSKKRLEYFKKYRKAHPQKQIYKYQGTSLGYRGEIDALNILKSSEKIIKPCDLKWKGKLVDVKTGKKKLSRKTGKSYCWKFLLTKQKGKVDLFLIICKDLEDKIEYIFLIPDKDLQVNNLTIAEQQVNKYSKYLITLL